METPVASTDQSELPEPGIDEDLLSSLPEEVLSYILSFMQTKYAVGTAVLSRRWKYLWTRVSNFDVDYLLVYQNGYEESLDIEYIEFKERRDTDFSRFVDRVLSQHANLNSLRRFRISLPMEHLFTCREVSSNFWGKLELASWSQLEEIDVEFEWDNQMGPRSHMHLLPESFYTLKNLKVLKLVEAVVAAGHCSVFLPSVKILELLRVEVMECESLGKLLSGCPAVETARMEYCYSLNRNENDILSASLPSLKNLTVLGRSNTRLCPIAIEAPSLEHLFVHVFEEFRFLGSGRLPCLVSAWVCGWWSPISGHSITRFINKISNAKEMFLSRPILRLLTTSDAQLPVFPKLTRLTILLAGSSRVLHSLLKSASKLQSLTILLENCGGMEWEVWEPACIPKCLLSSLEVIRIDR